MDARSRLRITLWPGGPLPHPGWPDWNVAYDLSDDSRCFVVRYKLATVAEPPRAGEAYLDLIATDLDNPSAVLAQVRRFGTLDLLHEYRYNAAHTPGIFMLRGGSAQLERLEAEHDRVCAEHDSATSVEEFVYTVRTLRDLTSAARIATGDLDHADAVWECPNWDGPLGLGDELDPGPDQIAGVRTLLTVALTDALEAFHPRVVETDDDEREGTGPFRGGEVSGFQLLCLEIFNHLVEGPTWRTCASARCGRLFVRQGGRAAFGQHRTSGVLYCDARCARNEAQRRYRKRKRAG